MKLRRIVPMISLVLIMLFVLALSSVIAQEGEPVGPGKEPMTEEEKAFEDQQIAEALANPPAMKQAIVPSEMETGQTVSPPANLTELESNNGFGKADQIMVGDVISGKIDRNRDQDYFKIKPGGAKWLLFDIDAQVNGSDLDAVICLYDNNKVEVACSDDSDGLDPLIYFYTIWDQYWIRVRDYNYPNAGGSGYTYTLSVSNPWLISAATNGTVDGMRFQKSDVLAWQEFGSGSEKWSMLFDASDLGIIGDLEAVSHGSHNSEDLSLVLGKVQSLPVGGSNRQVKPQEWIDFVAQSWGPITAGTFREPYWPGGVQECLTRSGEKVDALDQFIDVTISTTGRAKTCAGTKFQDEDLYSVVYEDIVLDGSSIPGLADENIVAAQYLDSIHYLTILGSGVIDGQPVDQKQIFMIDHGFNYPNPSVPFFVGVFWDGRDHGFNYNIDAIAR